MVVNGHYVAILHLVKIWLFSFIYRLFLAFFVSVCFRHYVITPLPVKLLGYEYTNE